ncbi:MAG: hypothetical protein AAF561_14610, partial [Planctomycetota bacterium]
MSLTIHRHAAILALAVSPAASAVAADLNGQDATATTTVVARTSDPAPDGNGRFSRFEGPAINDSGHAAFLGMLTGTASGGLDNDGVFISMRPGV